nr:MAG TPA: hypothetical protein [Caudoviricetes sp.]
MSISSYHVDRFCLISSVDVPRYPSSLPNGCRIG